MPFLGMVALLDVQKGLNRFNQGCTQLNYLFQIKFGRTYDNLAALRECVSPQFQATLKRD
jgi:hypothetical protein